MEMAFLDQDQSRLMAFLSAMGLEVNMDTFTSRLILQKTVYLLKEFGLDLGYSFGWHIRGPYSATLADDLFECNGLPPFAFEEIVDEIAEGEGERLQGASQALKGYLEDSRFLEVLASVRYLGRKGNRILGDERAALVTEAQEEKPTFSREEIERAVEVLNGLRLQN